MTLTAGVNADKGSFVSLSEHLVVVGMEPPSGIVASTKKRHPAWNGHNYTGSIISFWSRVVPDQATGCWVWTGSLNDDGYGRTGTPYWHEVYAHRLAWEMLRGRPAPKGSGVELDHECFNRACVRPGDGHVRELGLVANRKNHNPANLTTHCPRGHAKSGENLYVDPRGRRVCRECVRAANRRLRSRRAS